ncbi:MAG TPA: HDIG domain-containing protein [Nitriliruptorales bacterium]|nr:HDIG domain-containing protein [Nitriliruptorales bacterium]
MERLVRRYRAYRVLISALVLIAMPAVLSLPSFLDEAPIRVGEPAPRTVIAPRLQRVSDEEATERARRQARESVPPVLEGDPEARIAVVEDIRHGFEAVEEVRRPPRGQAADASPPPSPSPEEQVAALRKRLRMLDDHGRRILVTVDASTLDHIRDETVGIAQQLTRQQIREDDLEAVLDEQLRVEMAVRAIPADIADRVVEPLIRDALRPTVRVDQAATEISRRRAAERVSEVMRSFPSGSVVVSAGEVVSPVEFAALEQAGLEGADPRFEILRALAVVGVIALVVAVYLRVYRPTVWRSNRRLLLLASLVLGYTAILAGAGLVLDRSSVWLYAVPSGALGMLATILLGAPVGVLLAVPVAALTAFVAQGAAGTSAFAAAATLASVPLVTHLSARGDLRRATLIATAGYVLLAATFVGVFDSAGEIPRGLIAGVTHGLVAAVIVLGGLPFIESAFGLVTATGLIDLADRNHPLLRELEQKALGSYNHSIVVATLVERACRAIGADPLLASVMALYHDIGKVRRPYFFVENQFGMPNPHDGLEPEVSATIIHAHVTDGMEMARSYRLPPEVVEGIATHHGTTLVTYFYLEAVRRAVPGEQVDEQTFRYRGHKPRSKETAVLMLADCCEAASRAAAQHDRNLSQVQLEELVDGLLADRVDDGQLDESPLTFADLSSLRASFIETLVGVYHPRITYPERETARVQEQQQAPA